MLNAAGPPFASSPPPTTFGYGVDEGNGSIHGGHRPPGFPPGSSRGLGGPERRVRGDVARPRRPGWGAREPLRLGAE